MQQDALADLIGWTTLGGFALVFLVFRSSFDERTRSNVWYACVAVWLVLAAIVGNYLLVAIYASFLVFMAVADWRDQRKARQVEKE